MRARPPPGLALTGQEIASSNSTLNTLLGGRQKSWMTGGGSAVRPTPRAQGSQRQDLYVLPSPAPSNEPSPNQLASYNNVSTEASNVHFEASPESIPQLELPQPSSSLDQQEEPLSTHISGISQPYPQLQAGLPNVRPVPPYKRQKITQTMSGVPSLRTRKLLIEQHIKASGGFDALDSAVEKPRFRLLHDACHCDDMFFVALHQIFCLWTIDPNAVSQIDGFQDQQLLGHAFQLVAKLIRENEGISPLHLKWFSEFPSPLNQLLARSDQYRSKISEVRFFLGKLRSEKSSMLQECQQRGYPPLVDEMISRLGLSSRVLQGVFFTAGRRTVGIRDDVVGPQMEQVFLQDRGTHERLAARYNTNFPPSENEVRERNAWLIQQYLFLRNNPPRSDMRLSTHQQATIFGQNHLSRPSSVASFPQNQTTPNTSCNLNASAQSPGSVGVFQIPPYQHIETPNTASQHAALISPDGQISNQNANDGTASHAMPSPHMLQQQSSGQVYTSENTQQLRNGQLGPATPVLRNNHEQIPLTQMASNFYPGAVTSTTSQRSSHWQQPSAVMSQYTMVQPTAYSQPQTQPQDTGSRHTSVSGAQQIIPNFQRMNSIPFGMEPLGPARGGRVMDPLVVQSTPTDSARRPNHVTSQNSGAINWQTPMIPRSGENLPPHAPMPDLTALHQSMLRSPYLLPIDKPLDISPEDPAGRYYQAVADFAVGPKFLANDTPLRIENFVIPIDTYARLPKYKFSPDSPPIRYVQRGTLQYRMRCVQTRRGQVQEPSDFVTAETAWPASIFMELNNFPIELRRKLHHGKDLPVDITHLVQSISDNIVNQVKISIPYPSGFKDNLDYWFAVEIVEIFQHQQVINMTLSKHIPAEETIKNIKNSLSGSFIDEDDDEISMIISDLTINLADPFLARIFDTPVRGAGCLHRECFDLKTFLTTRNSKPKIPRQPSMVDVWRCPLCGKDARPYSLRVDDFLMSVRESLTQSNELHTKAIIVSADGSWKPKPEALPSKRSASRAGLDEDDLYDSEEDRIKKSETPMEKAFKNLEVIELDD